jgi:hypothetical protein
LVVLLDYAAAFARARPDGLAVHSLLADLATLTRNEVVTAAPDVVFTLYARPTAIQQKAFNLLAIDPGRAQ